MDENDVLIDRARSLMNMKRYEQAIGELQRVLAASPEDYNALILLTGCFIQLNHESKSDEYTRKLISVLPDAGLPYYYRAVYLNRVEKNAEAESMIRQAIEIEPWNAVFFGFLSGIYLDRKKWETALEYANEGLNVDPEDTTCLNYRTISLTKLNRKEELRSSIEETLYNDPEDSFSHANIGWSKLETGNIKEAQTHFWEALKINPDNDYAKEGMKEVIRSKNPLYRFFMNYQFWISKQQGNIQWLFILGVYFGSKLIAGLASKYPFFWAIYIPLMFFAYLTWIIEPFANIFLRFDSFGKYALDKNEKTAANITAFCLVTAIVSFSLYFTGNKTDALLYIGIYSITVVIPLSRFYMMSEKRRKGFMTYYTWALAVLGLIAVLFAFFNDALTIALGTIYFIGFIAYQWISNFRSIR